MSLQINPESYDNTEYRIHPQECLYEYTVDMTPPSGLFYSVEISR